MATVDSGVGPYAGELDSGFGDQGRVEFGSGENSNFVFYDVVIGDKIYATGSATVPADSQFVIACFDAGGHVDLGFGTSGATFGKFSLVGYSLSYHVGILSLGKLLVSGISSVIRPIIGLARINVEGDLDVTFSGDGVVTHDLFSLSEPAENLDVLKGSAIGFDAAILATSSGGRGIVLPDDRVIYAQSSQISTDNRAYSIIARFEKDQGALDTTFADKGYVEVRHPDYPLLPTVLNAITAQIDGKYVACGYVKAEGVSSRAFFVRYNENGTLDTSFGDKGYVVLEPYPDKPNPVAPSGDVRIVSVAQQANGKIVGVGKVVGSMYSIVVSLDVDGRLDKTFNNGRPAYFKVTESNTDYDANFQALGLQSDGKIVAVGWVRNSAEPNDVYILVARFLQNGSLDLEYSGTGWSKPDTSVRSAAFGVAIQKDDKIVVVGQLTSQPSNVSTKAVMLRLMG